jgi:hypothetical protein
MKTVQVIVYIIITLVVSSCEKNSTNPAYPFNATVLGKNIDCGLYQIQFTDDIEKVIELAGSSLQNTYIAENLPDSLKIENLKIILDFRKPEGTELRPCTAFGPALTWIHVITAKKSE